MLIYSYINTSGNWENEKLCGNTTLGAGVFSHNFEFSQFPRVLIYKLHINREKCFIFFYNIEIQRKKFSVLTLVVSTRLLVANQRSEFTNAIL
jgi:hypothetical protein